MGKFFKVFLVLFLMFFSIKDASAEEYRVLVLPDNIQFDSTNYYVYPDSSIIFASDAINEIKKDGRIKTISMTEIRDALRKNTKLSILTKKALKEYKYNYNISFVDFKAIADYFKTDKVLIITSQTDTQNYILRRTLWDFLNIPGASVIDPAYKMSTYAALIDVNKEVVLWQNTYYKKLATVENRMIPSNFAPATEQLEKIKSYSTLFLSPTISNAIATKILPGTLEENSNEIVNISDLKLPIQNDSSIELKTKIPVPQRKLNNAFGEAVNDL